MMDETEGESRYPANYGVNQGFGSTQRPKASVRNVPHPHSQEIADNYVDEDEEELEEDEEEQEVDGGDDEMNGGIHQNGDDDDDDDDTEEDDDGENHSRSDNFNLHRHPKKRKLKSLLSSFEFAPRLPLPPPRPPQPLQPSPAAASATKPSFGGRNTLTDWSEHETFVLLEAWGERFVQRGRKSLRSEEWQEVADKVSQESKIERTDTQCRNRLDTLKKKYKKEKSLLGSSRNQTTKWVYFKKMDMLMSSTIQQAGLSCGVDSGEYVFMNPTVYLNHANGLDEMRDSPGNTDSQEGDDDSDPLPLKRSKEKGDGINGGSFRLLADSINKFSEIYEKIENGKRKQMVELEKMRMEFHRELESQKREILDRARDEIAKIRGGDYEENDSAENISG
ncbi:trihelix transcription factor ASIL2-like [Cynara cardunculus var. scolymus]|uniref:Myb-like domain-containing protein n=1 Tax=Cynara cardunculus var. scolymus TaxID=59895 RepID=A0A103XW50_CYNCS|nr:trihelix transcription factor ASIL2-like [Cynara cardunculus var. scolymus]KVH97965.1 Myb-like domain-containing protein [Cynara cardunculus var. scolymus]